MTNVYLDASALVKLGVEEPEASAMRDALRGSVTAFTSIIGRIEFERAVRRSPLEHPELVITPVLERVELIPINAAIAGMAAALRPTALRSLDAIHLATMRSAADSIDVFYCYDERLAAAAAEYGIPVHAPR